MLKYEIIKRMKTLRESLLDDGLIDKTDKMIKDEIEAFLKANYNGTIKISQKPNADGKYEVSSVTYIEVKNRNITSLTNGMFIWTLIDGSFYCSGCKSLKSLEGAPKNVRRGFYCDKCNSLISLKGAPKEVSMTFDCSRCDSLISLEGAPEKVGDDFYCYNCYSLTSLEGAPEKVGGTFDCSYCKSLNSLDGAPKEVRKDFDCRGCKIQFTEDDVKKISDVKGEIKN